MSKVYVITGSNSGVGRDACRQLALLPNTGKVYLACRSLEKAKVAMDLLCEEQGVDSSKLEFVHFDASGSKQEIEKAVMTNLSDKRVDGVLLNAGGPGSDASGRPTGPNQVLDIVQINLIGHIHFLRALIQEDILHARARIIFSGSESARGYLAPTPFMPEKVDSYRKFFTGAMYGRFYNPADSYARIKGVATLYMKRLARDYSESSGNNKKVGYRIFVVSPGATFGTEVLNQKAVPFLGKLLYCVWVVLGWFGYMHQLEEGAKRYVDAITGDYDAFPSGAFIASAFLAAGPIADQASIAGGEQYEDVKKQDAAYEALSVYF